MRKTFVSAALRRAAEVIRERGFTQGRFRDASGALCAKGALNTVIYGVHSGPGWGQDEEVAFEVEVRKALDRLLPEPSEYGVDRLVAWADQDGRTQQEVAAMFEAAADEEERREATGDPGGPGEDHHDGGD